MKKIFYLIQYKLDRAIHVLNKLENMNIKLGV